MSYLGFDCMHHFLVWITMFMWLISILYPKIHRIMIRKLLPVIWSVVKNSANADIVLCGDYNARIVAMSEINADFWNGGNGELDRLIPENSDENSNLIEKMYADNILVRKSKDASTINKHGRELLGLCKSTGLLIFNGRLGQDRGIGEYTRDDTTGWSVVDYVIGTPLLFHN